MSAMTILVWYLSGALGGAMMWGVARSMNVRIFTYKKFSKCPTRIAILGIFLGAFLGFLPFLCGLIWTVCEVSSVLYEKHKRHLSWWTRPICDREDRK